MWLYIYFESLSVMKRFTMTYLIPKIYVNISSDWLLISFMGIHGNKNKIHSYVYIYTYIYIYTCSHMFSVLTCLDLIIINMFVIKMFGYVLTLYGTFHGNWSEKNKKTNIWGVVKILCYFGRNNGDFRGLFWIRIHTINMQSYSLCKWGWYIPMVANEPHATNIEIEVILVRW
jgi:hypothetical protein